MRPPAKRYEDLWEGNGLKSEFVATDVDKLPGGILEKYHIRATQVAVKKLQKSNSNGSPEEPEYKLSLGVQQAIKLRLTYNQVTRRFPWAVMWIGKDGEKRRKLCNNLGQAIEFHRKASRVTQTATIVSRVRHYDVPPQLRLKKFPPGYKWCPRCMKLRRFQVIPDSTFFGKKKVKNAKGEYEWQERKLQLLGCPMCGITNRDHVYRRSNQPWTIRRFKRGVTRARRRRTRR